MKMFVNSVVALLAAAAGAWPQTPAGGPSTPVQPQITGRDYAQMAIRANNLTGDDLALLKQKALGGDAQAAATLGMAYQLGCPGAPWDAHEALRWYYLAADQGSTIAANQIAVSFDPAEGFAGGHGHNPEEALKWYRKAAESGNDAVGIYNVGEMLHQLKRDIEAVDWYRKGAEKGEINSARALAELYNKGKALPGRSKRENWEEATNLFLRLANQGVAGAQFVMGKAYLHHWFGTEINTSAAAAMFRKAADQEMPVAELVMGDLYWDGTGLAKDKTEAIKWYLRAADHEDHEAQLDLAMIYERGLGVPKDFAEAYKWYELARAGGAPGTQIPHNATEAGDWIRLHHRYTADELEDGKKRLEKWRAEHGRLLRR